VEKYFADERAYGIDGISLLWIKGFSLMQTKSRWLLAFILSFFIASTNVFADEPPDQMAKRVTEDVLSILKQDNEVKHDKQKLYDMVNAKILPYFDFTHMTRLAVGRHWRDATPSQQATLTNEFKTLLVRTYYTALLNYKDQKILFKPLHMEEGQTDVTIKAEFLQQGAPPVTVESSMEKTPDGWKVYDVAFDGVSLVITYRSTFNSEIRAGGIDQLIKVLQQKNQETGVKK
jgi:phospholipid transport system substrate-binding protein